MPSSAWLNKSFLAMARTKLLPSRLSHHRTLWTAGGDSWLLEETAQQTTAHHTNKRYTAGLLFAQQFYLDADLVIIRHYRESTHPAGITPQGFLQTNTVLWLCFGKVEDCSRSQLPFKGRNSFKAFQSGKGGFARTRILFLDIKVQLTIHSSEHPIKKKFHSHWTLSVSYETCEMGRTGISTHCQSDRCWTDR